MTSASSGEIVRVGRLQAIPGCLRLLVFGSDEGDLAELHDGRWFPIFGCAGSAAGEYSEAERAPPAVFAGGRRQALHRSREGFVSMPSLLLG